VTETLALLQDFYREKLSQLLQHQAGARLIQQYDVNNTYQYIVNRDDVQLSWVAKAIEELGGAVVEQTEHDRSSSAHAVCRRHQAWNRLGDTRRNRWIGSTVTPCGSTTCHGTTSSAGTTRPHRGNWIEPTSRTGVSSSATQTSHRVA